MNKDLVVNNTRKKFKGELLDIILNQINNYFELVNSNYQIHHNYNIGDEVILNENHLLHGIKSLFPNSYICNLDGKVIMK